MRTYFLVPITVALLILSGCDNTDAKKEIDSNEANNTTITESAASSTTDELANNNASILANMPIDKIISNNQLILTRTVEAYSPNAIAEQVISKQYGDNRIEKSISYDDEGFIKTYTYSYASSGKPYMTGIVEYVDGVWKEEIHNLTNDERMDITYKTNNNRQIIGLELSGIDIDIDENVLQQPFIYNQSYQLTDMFYVLNKLEFHSLYQYDENGMIKRERIVLPALEAQADAEYMYNEFSQLIGFNSTALYPINDEAQEQDNNKIDESFGHAEINEQGDWTKLVAAEDNAVMTRTITYRSAN